MYETHPSTRDYGGPARYEIRLQGHLDARWAAWFDGLDLTNETDGTTTIHGPVADQAALGLDVAGRGQGVLAGIKVPSLQRADGDVESTLGARCQILCCL